MPTTKKRSRVKPTAKQAEPELSWADKMFGTPDPKTGKRRGFAVIGEKTGGSW